MGIDALRRAVRIAGGMTKLALRLGVGQSAVSNWTARGGVPAARCRDIELVTRGRATWYDLRPDIFGEPRLAGGTWKPGADAGDVDQRAINPVRPGEREEVPGAHAQEDVADMAFALREPVDGGWIWPGWWSDALDSDYQWRRQHYLRALALDLMETCAA